MLEYRFETHPVEILARRGETDRVSDVRRPRFELVRQHVPRALVIAHELDHVATELIGRHRLEDRSSAEQTADPHRPTHLVATEGIEVDVERVEPYAEMRRALSAVTDDQCAHRTRDRRNPVHWIHRSEGV